MTLHSFIEKIKHFEFKDIFIPKEDEPEETLHVDGMTRQQLVNQVFENFKISLVQETTDESMLFHTSYKVYLFESDFRRLEQSLVNTAQDVMKKIIKCVLKLKKEKHPEYQPHARYFQFQFIPLDPENVLDAALPQDQQTPIQQGDVKVCSTLYADTDYQSGGNDGAGQVVMTVRHKNSVSVANWAMNREALRGVDMRGRNLFRFDFKLEENGVLQPSSVQGSNRLTSSAESAPALAVLSVDFGDHYFIVNGQPSRKYEMQTDSLMVGGRIGVPGASGQEIARIDSDEVIDQHIIIRHTSQGAFEIQAKGDTMLNERALPTMQDHWTPLYNNSKILLNGDIQLRFNTKK